MTLENTLMKALMDTLMGMGSVFMILILICIIISLFKFIPKESAAAAGSDEPKTAAAMINDEEDDSELIAVITAALKMAMAQEAPPDTGSGKAAEPVFIVKSVKRRR
ncbi:MAG: OadG family protein [Firmicutes bacterium]|nr:OadG family protein [Bacillota bacterium]